MNVPPCAKVLVLNIRSSNGHKDCIGLSYSTRCDRSALWSFRSFFLVHTSPRLCDSGQMLRQFNACFSPHAIAGCRSGRSLVIACKALIRGFLIATLLPDENCRFVSNTTAVMCLLRSRIVKKRCCCWRLVFPKTTACETCHSPARRLHILTQFEAYLTRL